MISKITQKSYIHILYIRAYVALYTTICNQLRVKEHSQNHLRVLWTLIELTCKGASHAPPSKWCFCKTPTQQLTKSKMKVPEDFHSNDVNNMPLMLHVNALSCLAYFSAEILRSAPNFSTYIYRRTHI